MEWRTEQGGERGKEGELVQGSLKAADLLGPCKGPFMIQLGDPPCECRGLDHSGAHAHWITTCGDE